MAKDNNNLPAPQASRQAGGANLGFEAKLWVADRARDTLGHVYDPCY